MGDFFETMDSLSRSTSSAEKVDHYAGRLICRLFRRCGLPESYIKNATRVAQGRWCQWFNEESGCPFVLSVVRIKEFNLMSVVSAKRKYHPLREVWREHADNYPDDRRAVIFHTAGFSDFVMLQREDVKWDLITEGIFTRIDKDHVVIFPFKQFVGFIGEMWTPCI